VDGDSISIALDETDRAALAELSIADVLVRGSVAELRDAEGVHVGEATVLAPQHVVAEAAGTQVELRWDELAIDVSCDGHAVTLSRAADDSWHAPAGADPIPFSACGPAIETARILGDAAIAQGEIAGASEALRGCFTRSTWLWGTGRCAACVSRLCAGGCGSGTSDTCSDGWASTSCSISYCY
jgi:hypothetical protein